MSKLHLLCLENLSLSSDLHLVLVWHCAYACCTNGMCIFSEPHLGSLSTCYSSCQLVILTYSFMLEMGLAFPLQPFVELS